ncbi:hypothetical protein BDV09DRAFT_138642 [Aspergillus tetrazonus]
MEPSQGEKIPRTGTVTPPTTSSQQHHSMDARFTRRDAEASNELTPRTEEITTERSGQEQGEKKPGAPTPKIQHTKRKKSKPQEPRSGLTQSE